MIKYLLVWSYFLVWFSLAGIAQESDSNESSYAQIDHVDGKIAPSKQLTRYELRFIELQTVTSYDQLGFTQLMGIKFILSRRSSFGVGFRTPIVLPKVVPEDEILSAHLGGYVNWHWTLNKVKKNRRLYYNFQAELQYFNDLIKRADIISSQIVYSYSVGTSFALRLGLGLRLVAAPRWDILTRVGFMDLRTTSLGSNNNTLLYFGLGVSYAFKTDREAASIHQGFSGKDFGIQFELGGPVGIFNVRLEAPLWHIKGYQTSIQLGAGNGGALGGLSIYRKDWKSSPFITVSALRNLDIEVQRPVAMSWEIGYRGNIDRRSYWKVSVGQNQTIERILPFAVGFGVRLGT